jgi:hypothetical protein
VALFGGRVRLRSEGSGSLYSRDIRAGTLDSIGQPEWTKDLFTPRLSSRLDYAWMGEARLAFGSVTLGTQIEYVGPGFTTLGNPYFVNDRRETRVFGTLRVLRGRFSLAGSVGERRDNLADDKRGTTVRRTGTFTYTGLVGRWLVSSASVLVNGTTRDPLPPSPTAPTPSVVDSFTLKNVGLSVALMEQVRFDLGGVPNQITVTAAEQRVEDASPRFGDLLDARSRTVTLEYGLSLAGQFFVGLRPGYQEYEGGGVSEQLRSLGVNLSRRAPRSLLAASVTATYSQLRVGRQFRQDGTLSYRLTPRDGVVLQGRYTKVTGTSAPFSELLVSARYTRRW